MNDSAMNPMITYDQLYKLLHHKFEATHDEIRYWIRLSITSIESWDCDLTPFISDIPSLKSPPTYTNVEVKFLNPEFHFYNKDAAERFLPYEINRFVYRRDLTAKRNWQENNDRISDILNKANKIGILRLYDNESDKFTFYAPKKLIAAPTGAYPERDILWCDSDPLKFNHPDGFFLLYDILTIERIFLGKSLEACYEELEGREV